MLLRVIPIAVIEGAANHADRVVVGFLRPLVGVRDLGELGVSDFIENPRPDLGSPDLREKLAIPLGRHEGQVFFGDPGIAGQEELIEDLIAGSPFLRPRYILDEAIVGSRGTIDTLAVAGGSPIPLDAGSCAANVTVVPIAVRDPPPELRAVSVIGYR